MKKIREIKKEIHEFDYEDFDDEEEIE